jgi:hypothetical protein
MIAIGLLFVRMLCDCFKSRRHLAAEILVLRHQLNVLRQRAPRRLHLRWADRALFIWLFVAVLAYLARDCCALASNGLCRLLAMEVPSARGPTQIGKEVRDLIRRMSFENPLWVAVLAIVTLVRGLRRACGLDAHSSMAPIVWPVGNFIEQRGDDRVASGAAEAGGVDFDHHAAGEALSSPASHSRSPVATSVSRATGR